MKRKSAPYAKPLKALLESGKLPTNSVYLFIGNKSWEKGKSSTIARPDRTIVLPPNDCAANYDWPVNACDILMIETSPVTNDYIDTIVSILFSNGAARVTLISILNLLTIFKKDF